MRSRSQAGSSVGALALLLALLVGVGGWNYQRNTKLEEAEERPYRGYSEEQLATLLAAYESQHESDQSQYQRAAGRRAKAQGKDYFQEQVNEFERVQRASERKRAARSSLAGSQATLRLLREEQAKRDRDRNKLQLILRRATTF